MVVKAIAKGLGEEGLASGGLWRWWMSIWWWAQTQASAVWKLE